MEQINGAFTVSFAPDTFDAQISMLHHLYDSVCDVTYSMPVVNTDGTVVEGIYERLTGTFRIDTVFDPGTVMLRPFLRANEPIMVPIEHIIHIQYC